jgi:uncharacterized protein YkwD
MRRVLFVLAACGPMYQQPGGQPPPSNGTWQGPPGGGDPNSSAPASGDPWSRATPTSTPASEPAMPAAEPAAKQPTGSFAQRFVDAHNKARAQHCAAPLTWSTKLAAVAQKWADSLRDQGCKFGHSGGQYGENLAAGTIGALDPESTVAMWYDEIKQYKFPDGGFSMNTGHFTQLVWRGTKQVGCGHSQCKGNDIYVCEYDPPGNWDGEYRNNVLPKGCKK